MTQQSWAFFFMYEGIMTGGPKRTLDTAIACQKHDLRPILISNQTSPILDHAEQVGIDSKIIDIPKSLWQRQGKAVSLNPLNVIQVLRDLKKVSKQISDIIQSENLHGWWARGVKNVLMSRGATKKHSIPLVWDIGSEYRSRGLVAAIHYLAFRSSTKVVSQGRAVVDQTFPDWMLEKFGDKIYPIIPGLENNRVERLNSIFDNYDPDGPLCIVGTVNDRKNQLGLIEACNQLLLNNKKLKLKIVGDTPIENYTERCKSLTDRFPENYDWYGWSNDVVEVLKDCSALVMASKSEGLPQVVLEAMHAGRPVISVPVGAVPDLIQDGQNGLLCANMSSEQLGGKIEEFLNQTDSGLEEMRRSAKQTVNSVADHETWQQRYAELLSSIGKK